MTITGTHFNYYQLATANYGFLPMASIWNKNRNWYNYV